jgi:adenosylcobinamide kinase / adenosylcobinamide-phosphate guanylyltransferase
MRCVCVSPRTRPAGWRTVEAPRRVAEQIAPATAGASAVLVDCLTLLASNALLSAGEDASPQQAEAAVLAEVDGLLAACRASDATWIMVSNEVGWGLVPPYPYGPALPRRIGSRQPALRRGG